MAQDPERDEERGAGGEVDPSPDLDMVTLFSSQAVDGEMEANNIHAMLEANGIPSVVVGASVIPVLNFEVRVSRADLEEAQRLLEEAQAGGPEAASEAEAASEEGIE